MRLLVVNAGSSSVKVSLLDGDTTLVDEHLPGPGAATAHALQLLLDEHRPDATVHRIVHGGARFTGPLLVDAHAEAELEALADLAPLHNPPALALIDLLRRRASGLPVVACFDTAFFATLPAAASTYAVPEAWRVRLGVRRFGFHGLSHSWIASMVPGLLRRPARGLRVVSAHLGAGASLAAIVGGEPVDTTMGFTPLDGLVMATRCGSLDPGIVTHLIRAEGIGPDEVEHALEHDSGLLSLAGTADLAEVIEAARAGEAAAVLAYDVYLHRLRGAIAAMAAAMDGLDVLCFTGGAGEASAVLRADTCRGLGFLGIGEISGDSGDADAPCAPSSTTGPRAGARDQSTQGAPKHSALAPSEAHHERHATSAAPAPADRILATGGGPIVAVVHAREDLVMAHLARKVLGEPERSGGVFARGGDGPSGGDEPRWGRGGREGGGAGERGDGHGGADSRSSADDPTRET